MMSALPPIATSKATYRMSASPPESGHVRCTRPCPLWANSGLMQCSKKSSLFDHLVGAGEQRRWHGEAERLGGREIDHQLEFRGLLNRKIAGLRALENLVHVLGNTRLHG